jgi:surface polysaccharide O-acyltransferase-like enzyme
MRKGEYKRRDYRIELLRIVCTYVVILFHTSLSFHFNDELFQCYPYYSRLLTTLIWVAVCMFFFISGLTFSKQVSATKNQTFIQFIKKKALRLLVPYFLFTSLYSLNGHFFHINDFINGGFWHLWFLTVLFWCFVFAFACRNLRTIFLIIIAVGLSVINFPTNWNYLGVGSAPQWIIYFVEGMIVERYSQRVKVLIRNYHLWIVLTAVFVLCSVIIGAPYHKHEFVNTIGILSVLPTIYLGFQALNFSERASCTICSISIKTMGIYVIHYLVMIYLLSTTSMSVLGIGQLNHYLYLPIILAFSLVNFFISYCITACIQLTPLKKII